MSNTGTGRRVADEYYCKSAAFLRFVEAARHTIATTESIDKRLGQLRTPFAELLSDSTWLPESLASPAESSNMGTGVATYLLYRSGDGALGVGSLVLSPGTTTPVHDHLAWGLVGLYRGEQVEEVYRRLDDRSVDGVARLASVERRHLRPGDFYDLIPPEGDIHKVVCGAEEPSVSIHMLGNDFGCVDRHVYHPDRNVVVPFRSGYVNVPCR